jgi:outer membrane immunogenic protein
MHMMRNAIAIIVWAILFVVPCRADDASAVDTTMDAPAPIGPAPIWQGIYLGVSGGRFEGDGTITNLANGRITETTKQGEGAGLYGGYNWQSGPLVLGIEGDWSSGRKQVGAGLFTVRGRAGWTFGRALVYGTAGVGTGTGRVNRTVTTPNFVDVKSDEQQHVGWVAGGGIEAMLTSRLSLKGEALYFDAGSERYDFPASPPISAAAATFNIHEVIYRAGLSYHFN